MAKVKKAYRRLVDYKLGQLPFGGYDQRLIDLVMVAEGKDRVELKAKFGDEVEADDNWREDPKKFKTESGDPDDADLNLAIANLTEFGDI